MTERPVVSAGQYGMALNKLVFTVDTATGEVQAETQDCSTCSCTPTCRLGRRCGSADYPADPNTAAIVAAAVADGRPAGCGGRWARSVARSSAASWPTDAENRGAESTLGNLVAEVQKWATRAAESGSAQIAFMNPGGLRGTWSAPALVRSRGP